MKKLSKLKLHNVAILNDDEMKSIVGGYVSYGLCTTGEYLFTCIADFTPRPTNNPGSVCAKSASAARQKVIRTLQDQCTYDQDVRVTCSM